jgi:hypothetical protein
MSRSQRRSRSRAPRPQPSFARDLRGILRGLARAAAISSVGLAGCGLHHTTDGVGQSVPEDQRPGAQAGTGSAPGVAGTGMSPSTGAAGRPGPDMPGTAGIGMPPQAGTGTAGREVPPETDAGPPRPQPEEWMSLCSETDGVPSLLTGLRLAREIDHAAVYFTGTIELDIGNSMRSVHRMFSTGTPCESATDAAACQAAIESLLVPTTSCGVAWECDPFLLVTEGDEVSRVEENAALNALLGTVDTPTEAALVALLRGDQKITCPTSTTRPLRGTETRAVSDGYEVRTEWEDCGNGLFSRTVFVTADGAVEEIDSHEIAPSNCAVGRRPEGLRAYAPAVSRSALGAYFARAAALEAASVVAFERMARELAALGAPQELVASAARSALDEVRHTRAVTVLARRFGGEPGTPEIAPLAARSAQAIALENAVEGCVRETYGALVAHYQAQTAHDPVVRAAMAVIAEDETRHATLSWQVAEWLEPRLSHDERRAVHAARAAALATLRDELDAGIPRADMALIGLPEQPLAVALLDRLAGALALS